MEFLAAIALAVLLFFGVRLLLQRQGQRLNKRIEEAVTPENARMAAKLLTDDQHREVYRAIAADDGQRALALFKHATGAPVKDCLIAVQALHRFPQKPPSELQLEDELGGDPAGAGPEAGTAPAASAPSADEGEYVEDVIDGVRADADSDREGRPIAEADPETGEIIGENREDVPDIPGGRSRTAGSAGSADAAGEGGPDSTAGSSGHDEVDEKARRLLAESGFSLEDELTIPEDWAEQDQELAGFHLEVQRGEEKITLSHEDLEPWVHDQLYALLRDDHVDEAATLLADHSPLTEDEAHKFLVVFKDQA
ncbi:hypothetical protein [Nesterenkonia xinjiangensis]|uniref:Uncharacterized protein n=1 Tax=Nesterenkonia xinjiangensis TaxID=225327 RepID=A0A7Z0GJN4_9MICC|nr:hypothetical protein [Nesterenkonia xinjiangensis]NYJ77205.1 hypothetical protein [Nesterenkonia xinjiangensis]